MRRRKLLLVAAGTVLFAGLVMWYVLRPGSYMAIEQFDRIQVGMTQGEVAAILGCPPGSVSARRARLAPAYESRSQLVRIKPAPASREGSQRPFVRGAMHRAQ